MSDFHYHRDSDGVALISWAVPEARLNTMTLESLHELADLFAAAFSDTKVKGVVLTSGKADFSGGMYLDALQKIRNSESSASGDRIFATVMGFHRIFRRIEMGGANHAEGTAGKPVIAALPGTGVGIGYEIPLACHRIMTADNPKAVIGLPEIKVGLFPGAGGTTRLVRRLGISGAAPFLLKGTLLAPQKALASGLIDEVTAADELVEKARQWVLGASSGDVVKPWDQKGYRIPGGSPYDPKGYMTFMGLCAMVSGNTLGLYPAANAMMSAIYEGAQVPFDAALEIEARWFSKLLMEPASVNMVQTLFLDKRNLEKGAGRPAVVKKAKIKKIGIVGAGMMGSGIAMVSARAGLDVALIDQNIKAAGQGKGKAAALLEARVKRQRMSKTEAQQILDRITPSDSFDVLKEADFVIEAVFEDLAVKADVLSRIEATSDCILASNTSTLPISGLAKSCRSPDRFLGVHFFSPVDRMQLVEVIRGRKTADVAVALALDYVGRIRKTPIVVNDARFFYANRCIIPYLNEGIRMVGEGVQPALVENAARQCGMPIGPLQLVDETSIELAVSIAKATKAALGSKYHHEDADRVIFKLASFGRLGRKSNAGFYEYSDTGQRQGFWPELRDHFPIATPQPAVELLRNRLLLIQAIEAVHALDEGVLIDVREGNVGAVLGWGFAPWSGGPFSWLDGLLENQLALPLCESLSRQYGERFKAPAGLINKAKRKDRFTSH